MGYLRRLTWNATLAASGNTLGELRRLRRAQWLSPDEMMAEQRVRLTALMRHAAARVPYYADLVSAVGRRQPGPELLHDLPILTKELIRENSERLVASDAARRGTFTNTSGGSTGEPVVLIQDREYRDRSRAVAMLFNEWAGYRTGFPMIKLWGSERDLFVGRETFKTTFVRMLRNERWLNAFRMTPEQMRSYIEEINRVEPEFVLAYVESIYDLARFAEREGITIRAPRSVMTSAGPLEAPVRATIERVFGAPVFNRYGSREVGDIACDCSSHRGLHVCSPYHLVEVLREDGTQAQPGESGELVITLLTNLSMPLIRYRIGDKGRWAGEPCDCGRPWPLLETVEGRVSDIFVRSDGGRVHGEYFTHLFYFLPWVRKFQVVQESLRCIDVRLVPMDERGIAPFRAELAEIEAKVRLVMGNDCAVSFIACEQIAPTASGKFRYTISKVIDEQRITVR